MIEAQSDNGLDLDKWQKEVLSHEGDITIRSGRQVGKSTVVSLKAYKFATENPNTVTLVIAASQRQSSFLFGKIRQIFDEEITQEDSPYDGNPTLSRIILKNGSRIYCVPTGKTGVYIRGFTVDLLIADEAAYIPETVWLAVIPMLAVSKKKRGKGFIILLSTPFGKGGFFYNTFNDPDFKSFHISSEKCSRIPKKFLMKEKKRLSKVEYAQEYLGEFVDEWNQFFSTALIKNCCKFAEYNFEKEYLRSNKYYLGVDVARYGGDENAFIVAELNGKHIRIVHTSTTSLISTVDTIGRIKKLHEIWKFKKIFIDDGGIGGGVLDVLVESLGNKVIGLNNASRSVEKTGRKRILKEDLYSNALVHMEAGDIELINELRLVGSLKSMTYEYTSNKSLKIYGRNSHLAEAFVRACWCIKQKGLNLYIA